MIELDTSASAGAKIRVIGVGGGGCNAINNMVKKGLRGVDLIAINTDKQALDHSLAPITINVGHETTGGKGAGSNPEIGKKSAEESMEDIKDVLKSSDMLFVTCGMGGGTGTGGAPVVARIGQEIGALVVGIVTTPFKWEGPNRINAAVKGIDELRQFIDALIVIPNTKLIDVTDKSIRFQEAYLKVDEILYNATRGIADLITHHGYVNVDFADVKTVMRGMGDALMGIGTASGPNRALEATQNALNSPLLDGISISGAQAALVNVTGGSNLGLHEVDEVLTTVSNAAGKNVNIIHGVVVREEESEDITVTVVATGFALKGEKSISDSNINNGKNVAETSMNIPFPGRSSENKHQVGTKFPFPNRNRNFTSDKVADTSYHQDYNYTSPKGTNELKKFDTPAWSRRGNTDAVSHFANVMSGLNKNNGNQINEDEKSEHNQIVIENFDKPAFLRKIMD